MLEKVCSHVHNFFTRTAVSGTYTIDSGSIDVDADLLKEGQRFHIVGSDLNDGVYTWHAAAIRNDDDTEAAQLQDEEFTGSILPMAVPKAFLDLVSEISTWVTAYGTAALSPFQSENVIGVYSYTKASGSGSGDAGSAPATWESAFASRLNAWRRTGDNL